MRSSDGTTVRCRQQHRQAVCCLNDASDASLAGDDGIGFVDSRAGPGIARADADNACAVDLAQEDRRCAGRLAQQRPVRADGAGVITDRGADVHRRVRRATDAPRSGRHQRANAGDAPVGRQPVGANAHVASGQAEGCDDANAGSAMHASKIRITVGTWSSRQSIRLALKICGTSTQSARPGVSPWQKRPVAG